MGQELEPQWSLQYAMVVTADRHPDQIVDPNLSGREGRIEGTGNPKG
jgi:hypothetical protein